MCASKAAEDIAPDEALLRLEIYPWQQQQKQFLLELANSNKLHHAFLLHGQAYLGKFDFACAIAASLFCAEKGEACGACHSCALVRSMAHPDFYLLRPEKEGKAIPVEDVRDMIEFMSKSSSRDGKRIVLIDQCQQMNANASNALLKFLEEPGEDVHIFLVCSELDALLPTIVSRAQKLAFNLPSAEQASQWLANEIGQSPDSSLLEYAGGSPLLAIQLVDEPLYQNRKEVLSGLKNMLQQRDGAMSYVSIWSDFPLIGFLSWWHACLVDALKLNAGADIQHLRFKSLYADLELLAGSIAYENLMSFSEELFVLRRQLLKGAPFAQELMLESLLVQWQALGK